MHFSMPLTCVRSRRGAVMLLLLVWSVGCGSTSEPQKATVEQSAMSDVELAEAGIALMADVGALAEAHGASCDDFAEQLNRYLEANASLVKKMNHGGPRPVLSTDQLVRGARAMRHLAPLFPRCRGNRLFAAAIGQIFSKQRGPARPVSATDQP